MPFYFLRVFWGFYGDYVLSFQHGSSFNWQTWVIPTLKKVRLIAHRLIIAQATFQLSISLVEV